MNKKVILAGGSGYLGRYLAAAFTERGYEVIILSRRAAPATAHARTVIWDGEHPGEWHQEFESATAVVNLTGKSVDCRYTPTNKALILQSRLNATRAIGQALTTVADPPEVWLNAASATIYEDTRGDQPANDEENGVIGSGFSVDVCQQWEEAFHQAALPGLRQICLRIAIVLSADDGAMVPMLRLAKLGLGGKMGSGDQMLSWIHAIDCANAVVFLTENKALSGVFNIASADAHTNADFMRALRKQVGCPIGLPTPGPLLAVGARLIQTETELILKSRNVIPRNLEAAGFTWQYPTLEQAFEEVCV